MKPHVWVDAGGTLSLSVFWISVGSITGTIHVVDATASGTAQIDARPLLSGGHVTWTASGMGQLCSGGGAITGCIFGSCGTLASWGNVCPGFLTLSGSTSGQI